MKVLIFGIGGFVGPYLAQEFLGNGYEVYGSDIQVPKKRNKEFTYYQADLLDRDSVNKVVQETKPDIIVNLAAVSSVGLSWKLPQKTMLVNVVGALNILEAACQGEPVPKVMFLGSSEEYEVSNDAISEAAPLNANNPYGISKMTQEKFTELYRTRYGMQIYYVRPFNHTGIGQKETFVLPNFCKQVAEIEKSGQAGTIQVGNLAAKRDFSHVRDIVRAYRMILEKSDYKKVYNVGSGKAYGLAELLAYVISLSSQKITVEVVPERFRPVDNPVICCDNHCIQQELGWRPEYNVFDALKEMFEHDLHQ